MGIGSAKWQEANWRLDNTAVGSDIPLWASNAGGWTNTAVGSDIPLWARNAKPREYLLGADSGVAIQKIGFLSTTGAVSNPERGSQ